MRASVISVPLHTVITSLTTNDANASFMLSYISDNRPLGRSVRYNIIAYACTKVYDIGIPLAHFLLCMA